jgi:geranylgeranyl diphosphate synthase type I
MADNCIHDWHIVPPYATIAPDMSVPQALDLTKQTLHPLATDFFAQAQSRFGHLDPMTADLVERLAQFCIDTGKQIRPFLVGVGAALSQQQDLATVIKQPAVQRIMLAVQLTHQRILMADDVADRDETRYGSPTIEAGWREHISKIYPYLNLSRSEQAHIARSFSEVAGIWLQAAISAHLNLTPMTDQQRENLQKLWLQYMYEHTVTGWLIHQEQGQEPLDDQVSLERYTLGLELVTADYTFVGPLLIGATLGNRYTEIEKILRSYGQAAGILFQLSDDMIGIFGETAKTGKPVGNDVREGKKTVPIQLAFRAASSQQKQRLQTLVGKRDITANEVNEVRQIIRDTGAYAETIQRMTDYAQQCQTILAKLPNSAERTLLADAAQMLVGRDH